MKPSTMNRPTGWGRRARLLGLVTGLALAVSGCSHNAETPDKPQVGVILPTADTAPRWEDADGPALERTMLNAGLDPDVENVAGDRAQFVGMADQMISSGSKVLVVASPDDAVVSAVVAEAKKHGVPTIDYDLRGAASPADYSLTLDYRAIGELQGRGLIRGVRGTKAAKIVEIEQAPTKAAAAELIRGQHDIVQPRYDTGSYVLARSQQLPTPDPGTDQANGSGTNTIAAENALVTQALAAAGGAVNGVLAANDQVAAAAINVLRAEQLIGKVTVTGFGEASPETLKAILRGDQFMSVYTPVDSQATATTALAAALANGNRARADHIADAGPVKAGAAHVMALTPATITLDTIKQVFDSGVADSSDVCTDELALRCNQLSIS